MKWSTLEMEIGNGGIREGMGSTVCPGPCHILCCSHTHSPKDSVTLPRTLIVLDSKGWASGSALCLLGPWLPGSPPPASCQPQATPPD